MSDNDQTIDSDVQPPQRPPQDIDQTIDSDVQPPKRPPQNTEQTIASEETLADSPSRRTPDVESTMPLHRAGASGEADPESTVAQTTIHSAKAENRGDETLDVEYSPPGGGIDRERTVDMTTAIGAGGGARPPGAAAPRDGELPPGHRIKYIGDYELLAVLGQGGMGVVYKARQVTLNRLVALKMIRNAEFAGEDQLRRFQLEAEAVARLDHVGIVPIYEVGQYEDQRYFSMKLVEGGGLDKRLKHYAEHPREAARLVADIADAIFHAHQRGILHRDLKPANILVDQQGKPHVTDYGLAKKVEEDDGLTMTGAVLGTPSYMAPEQAMGHTSQITTSTDIYGIGAILYATLTGKAPFGADSVLATLEQVRERQPEPPTKMNINLPKDLEVICLKTLEKDPRRRYESARELADDLERWLRGEPIKARPVSRAVRLGMWCKRNPVLASLSAGLAAMFVIGVVGITVQWREAIYQRAQAVIARDEAIKNEGAARKAEAEASAARDAAVTARASAERSAQIAAQQATEALTTINEFVTGVMAINDPAFAAFRKKALDAAQLRVEKVANTVAAGMSKEATAAAILMEAGKLYRELGQSDKALAVFKKCEEIYLERLAIKNRNDASRMNLGLVNQQLALSAEELNRDFKAVLTYNKKAAEIFQDILENPRTPNPGDLALGARSAKLLLAEAIQRVGGTYLRMGDIDGAVDSFRKAINLRREISTAFPNDLPVLRDLSFSLLAMAEAAYRKGDKAGAAESYKQLVEAREKILEKAPDDFSSQVQMGDAYYMRGWFELRSGLLDKAFVDLEKSRGIREALVKRQPLNAVNQRALGMSLYFLGVRAELAKDETAAKREFDQALVVRSKLALESPENDRRQMELMLVLARTGNAAKAAAIADRLAAGPKLDNEARYDLARTYALLSKADPAAAARYRSRAVDLIRDAVKAGYTDRVSLETEADLIPIRDDAGFVELVKSIKI